MENSKALATRGYIKLAAKGCMAVNVPVASADEASRIWSDYRDANGLGASDMKSGCGNICEANGKVIAKVSYNGRVWDATGKTMLQDLPEGYGL